MPAIAEPSVQDDPVADAHGYALAANFGAQKASACNKVAPQFRRGCMARVADARAGLLERSPANLLKADEPRASAKISSWGPSTSRSAGASR
jgi:hypothetical protein